MARGFVNARLDVVLVANAVDVGGSEPALDPLALDFRLELRNAAVEGVFLFGSDGGVVAAAAAAVFLSSNRGKGGFNIRREFLEFSVLASGGPSEMVERPLNNLVTVCRCGCQVVKMGVEIAGQIIALGENAGLSVDWGRVGFGDGVVDELGGGRRSERIFSPR